MPREPLPTPDSSDANAPTRITEQGSSPVSGRGSTPHGETIAVPAEHRGVVVPGIPAQIGRYRILRKLDEGGMGTVYQAEQDKPRRVVALKVIRPGRMSAQHLRRFEHESQILGRLQHPGIAQIYEAGTADNGAGLQPFFAMEYIADAKPITEYAATKKLGTRERMELVARSCDAVQHAHQKGVIHRDLKPDNILVDPSGQPKILDFGVAKATESDIQATTMHTDVGQLVGTLSYMSPEQVIADPLELDVRSDVYALGVVLYELLSQRMPYDVSGKPIHEAARMIREQEPTRLSVVSKVFRGDVETVVAKALEKDKTRRYQSAGELAADIRRYLASEPIVARPASTFYQVRKFAQRNQAFVIAVAVVFVVMLSATGVSAWLAVRATRAERITKQERDRAQIETVKAEQTTKVVQRILGGIDPYQAEGLDTTLLQRILKQAEARIGTELADQPEVEAAIRLTLGRAYRELASFDLSEQNLRRADELLTKQRGDRDRQTLDARTALLALLERMGRHQECVDSGRAVVETCRTALGEDAPETLDAMTRLGACLLRVGRYPESETCFRKALAGQREHLGPEAGETLVTMGALAQTLKYEQKFVEAEKLAQTVYDVRRRTLGDDAPVVYESMHRLAAVWQGMKKYEQAEDYYRKALDGMSRLIGPERQATLTMRNNLGALLSDMERHSEAEVIYRENLQMRRRALGPDHPETHYSIQNVGDSLRMQGRLDEAEPFLREALEGRLRTLGPDHVETILSHTNLATLLSERGRFAEAADLFGAAVAGQRKLRQPGDRVLEMALYNWAATLENAGKSAEAEPVFQEVIAMHESHSRKDEAYIAAAYNGLGKCLDARGKFVDADAKFQKGLEIRRRLYKSPDMDLGYSLNDFGDALLRRKEYAAAEPYWREYLTLCENDAPPGDWKRFAAKSGLGSCLAGMGRFAEAEPLLLAGYEELGDNAAASPSVVKESVARTVRLYEAWETAEPGKGYADKAARWRLAAGEIEKRQNVETSKQDGGAAELD